MRMVSGLISALVFVVGGAVLLHAVLDRDPQVNVAEFTPEWQSIASWPARTSEGSAQPDPGRRIMGVVLDDSGSMSGEPMAAAKKGVIAAVSLLDDNDVVTIVGINSGLILPMMRAELAKREVARSLEGVRADGNTELGETVAEVYGLIEEAAAAQRGYGSYRILIATDGAANDATLLRDWVGKIVRQTPIDIATIGIGIGTDHILNMPGIVSYTAVDRLEELSAAMQTAAAEQTSFEALAEFETVN